jgi:hypothetical protein
MNDEPERSAAQDVGPAIGRAVPTSGADDELLADPPMGAPPGGLDGYRAGLWLRVFIVVFLIGSIAGAVWLVRHWQAEEAAARAAPKLPSYTLATEVEGSERPRQLVWDDGVARLGLSRAQPGVEEIVLPDRRIRLAPGHDVAQIKVEVREGRTVSMAVLVGKVIQLPPADPESPPTPGATAP